MLIILIVFLFSWLSIIFLLSVFVFFKVNLIVKFFCCFVSFVLELDLVVLNLFCKFVSCWVSFLLFFVVFLSVFSFVWLELSCFLNWLCFCFVVVIWVFNCVIVFLCKVIIDLVIFLLIFKVIRFFFFIFIFF